MTVFVKSMHGNVSVLSLIVFSTFLIPYWQHLKKDRQFLTFLLFLFLIYNSIFVCFLLLFHVLLQFRTFVVTWLEEEFLWYFYYFLFSLSTRSLKLILCFGIGAPAILCWVKKVCLCSSAGVLWEHSVLHGADCLHGVWLVIVNCHFLSVMS